LKKLLILLILSVSQSGCLAVAIIEGATDVVAAVATAPIKVGSAVVDAAKGDEDKDEKNRD
jgi:hypothetical protein|tara:strand:- start:2797 stop:2979 length:183 start_codon:yes stop_codon:yes gene_type:complete